MEVVANELALRYLLELSPDIRMALLLDQDGAVVGAAPEPPAERIAAIARDLATETGSRAGDGGSLELDVTFGDGAVFLVTEGERSLLCITGPMTLPGLILHDMRVVLDDLRRGAGAGEPAQ